MVIIVNLKILHPTTACRTCISTDCYNMNKYCINTGFLGRFVHNMGQNIIKQQLREEFIYETQPDLWWEYMKAFDDKCEEEDDYLNECSIDVMKKMGIDDVKIENFIN